MICAGITYNAGTNLITVLYNASDATRGASFTNPYLLVDIYDTSVSGGWGVVVKAGQSYYITAKLRIESSTTYFQALGTLELDPSIYVANQDILTIIQAHVRFGIENYDTQTYSSFNLTFRLGVQFTIANTTGGSFAARNTLFNNIMWFAWSGTVNYTQSVIDCTFNNCRNALGNPSAGFIAQRIRVIGGLWNFNGYSAGTFSDIYIGLPFSTNTQFRYALSTNHTSTFRNIDLSSGTAQSLIILRSVSIMNFINCKRNSASPYFLFYAPLANADVRGNFLSEFILNFNLTGVTYVVYDLENQVVINGVADNTATFDLTYYSERSVTDATVSQTTTIYNPQPFTVVLSKTGYKTVTISDINVTEGLPTIIRAELELTDLTITAIQITDTTTIGATDGALTITAEGGDEDYEYSIDGIDYQESNEFAGLPAGEYTAYVRDGEGTIATFVVEISEPIPEQTIFVEALINADLTDEDIECDVTEPLIECEITLP